MDASYSDTYQTVWTRLNRIWWCTMLAQTSSLVILWEIWISHQMYVGGLVLLRIIVFY